MKGGHFHHYGPKKTLRQQYIDALAQLYTTPAPDYAVLDHISTPVVLFVVFALLGCVLGYYRHVRNERRSVALKRQELAKRNAGQDIVIL